MELFAEVAGMILRVLPLVFVELPFALFFWAMVGFVLYQYRKMAQIEEALFGIVKNHPWQKAITAAGYGVVAGVVGSFIFVFMGVVLQDRDILYLWPLALLLMLVHPRFICFAYAGGIVALSSLLTGWPQVNVLAILALVAVLHLIEGVLVALSGHESATPVFVRRADEVVGGFTLQSFWPLPVVIVLLLVLPHELLLDGVAMPAWWPLIPPASEGLEEHFMLTLVPVAAVLGYGDIAITRTPQAKARQTAVHLMVYSVVLLLLTLLGTQLPLFVWLSALFSPVAHEWMILHSRRREESGEALYVAPSQGVRILDVLPDSLAQELGLASGDVILKIGSRPVNSRAQLSQALLLSSFYLELTVQRGSEPPFSVASRGFRRGGTSLGIILVPEPGDPHHVAMGSDQGWLARLLRRRSHWRQPMGDSQAE